MKISSFAALCLTLAVTAMAPAQPCDNWTGTMPLPVVHPGIFGRDILAHGDLVLVADDSLLVYDLRSAQPLIGRCALPATVNPYPGLREVDGTVYVAVGENGVLRLDLSDPTNPTWETAFVPGTNVTDLAAFSGGVVVVSAPGDIHVLDSLESDGQVFAHITGQDGIDDDLFSVAAHGHIACVGGRGFAVIDLTDPAVPVLSARTLSFTPDYYSGVHSIVMSEDRAAAVGWIVDLDHETTETYLYAFDLDDPPGSPPAEIQTLSAGVADLELIGGRLVGATTFYLLAYSWPELVIETIAAHPQAFAGGPRITPTDASLLLMDTGGPHTSIGLVEYPLGPAVMVPPAATLPRGYAPAGCGRFGRTIHSEIQSAGYEWWGTSTFEIYDQQDPLNPFAIHALECAISDERWCTHEFVGPHDRWAVIASKVEEYYGGSTTHSMSVFVVDEQGNRFPCLEGVAGESAIDGDILWTISRRGSVGNQIEAFDLSGEAPASFGDQAIESEWGTGCMVVDDILIICGGTALNAYDVANPSAVVFRGSVTVAGDLRWPLRLVADNLVLAGTGDGLAVFEVVPQADPPVAARGYLDLGDGQSTIAAQGPLVATAGRQGWRLVSIADPDAPVVLSETVGQDVDDFVWSDDYLYVGVPGGMYLYDVADPTAPVFVGQVAGSSSGAPCAKDYYLMKGNGVFPRDCADPLSSEGGPPEQDLPTALPGAVALHPVAPNPFNPRMTVTFDLPQPERVSITIHDLRGRRVATLVDAEGVAGRQAVTWLGVDERGEPLPSGTYLVRLSTASAVRTVKAVLVR